MNSIIKTIILISAFLMLLISPVQLAIQYFLLGEMIGFSPKMETFIDFLHIELFLLIIYMIFDLWKNVKQTKGTKLYHY